MKRTCLSLLLCAGVALAHADAVTSFAAGLNATVRTTGGTYAVATTIGNSSGNLAKTSFYGMTKATGSLDMQTDLFSLYPQFGTHGAITLTGTNLGSNNIRWNVSAPALIGKVLPVTYNGVTVNVTVTGVSGTINAAAAFALYPPSDPVYATVRAVTIQTTGTSTTTLTGTFSGGNITVTSHPTFFGMGGPRPAPFPTSIVLSSQTPVGGTSFTGTVNVSEVAPPAGITVTLTRSSSLVTVPASITIAGGSTSAGFSATSSNVVVATPLFVIATANGYHKSILVILKPWLSSFTLTPTSVAGGVATTAKVTLNAPAPAAGVVVTFSWVDGRFSLPSSVTIPSGMTSASFTITAPQVAVNSGATFIASSMGYSIATTLTITP